MLGAAVAIFRALGAIMFGPSPAVHCFAVDAARLTEAREVAKAAGQGVSANDVLTPGFGNVCAPRLLRWDGDVGSSGP